MRRNDFFKYLLLSGGNAASRAELETESLPYTFTSESHKLRNYRIYGNTGGVGDLQENGKYLIPVKVSGKNKLYNPAGSQTKNGLNIIINSEGHFIFNGTATEITTVISKYNFPGRENDILSGCPSGGSNSSYSMRLRNVSTNEAVYDYGNGVSLPNLRGNIEIRIAAGAVCNNLIFKPMVRPSNTSAEYEPYHSPQTVNIELDAPLMADEYIDFRERKRFNSDDTSEIISMPTLPTINGTNIFTVNTEVQPSKVYIQGKISEIPSVSQSLQSSPQTLNLQPLSLDVMPIDRSEFQINDISEVPVEDENSVEEIPETENFETSGGEENAE